MKTAANSVDAISTGLAPVLNLSGNSGSFELSEILESVKISIVDLTPEVRGVVYKIPVRYVSVTEASPLGFLEEAIESGTATKSEFRYMRKLLKFLSA